MAHTFGGATSHRVQFTTDEGSWTNNGTALVTGWYYVTTWTAGRALFGWSTINRCEMIGTAELRIVADCVTTDGEWETSDANLVINQWYFIAVLGVTGNTAGGQFRVWRGTAETAPEAVTVANTVPKSGNFTASTSFAVGNIAGTTKSFTGLIEQVHVLQSSTSGINGWATIETSGTISVAEEDNIYRRWVLPLWAGRFPIDLWAATSGSAAANVYFVDLTGPEVYVRGRTRQEPSLPIIIPPTATAVYSETCGPGRASGRDLYSPVRRVRH